MQSIDAVPHQRLRVIFPVRQRPSRKHRLQLKVERLRKYFVKLSATLVDIAAFGERQSELLTISQLCLQVLECTPDSASAAMSICQLQMKRCTRDIGLVHHRYGMVNRC